MKFIYQLLPTTTVKFAGTSKGNFYIYNTTPIFRAERASPHVCRINIYLTMNNFVNNPDGRTVSSENHRQPINVSMETEPRVVNLIDLVYYCPN